MHLFVSLVLLASFLQLELHVQCVLLELQQLLELHCVQLVYQEKHQMGQLQIVRGVQVVTLHIQLSGKLL